MRFATLRAKVHLDSTGACAEVPVLMTPDGILEPLLDYCLARSHDRSVVWMKKVLRSVALLLEYVQRNEHERGSYQLFQNFGQRLYTGTFDRVTGLDPSELCWRSRSVSEAGQIIVHLTDFFEWLAQVRPAALQVNPRYAGARFDRLTDEVAYQFRRDRAFLGHSWATNHGTEGTGRMMRGRRRIVVEASEPPAFPDDRFEELLFSGFKVGNRHDLRGMLITLLLHSAGFRESEPFHLYVGDVFPDPRDSSRATVLIHHPSQGVAPADWVREATGRSNANRAMYLAHQFGLPPRTDMLDVRRAGWKGGMHDAPFYKAAHWFLPSDGELFLQLWRRYLEQVARVDRRHPFAFINLGREPKGDMYCLGQYNKAHAAACRRIGLPVSKELGTTPHGHRHAYGQRLRKAGVDKFFIRRFMHHSALQSQEVYTQPNLKEMQSELEVAATRLHDLYGAGATRPFVERQFLSNETLL